MRVRHRSPNWLRLCCRGFHAPTPAEAGNIMRIFPSDFATPECAARRISIYSVFIAGTGRVRLSRIGLYACGTEPPLVSRPCGDNPARGYGAVCVRASSFCFGGCALFVKGCALRRQTKPQDKLGCGKQGRVVAALGPPSPVFRSGRLNPRSLPRGWSVACATANQGKRQ